LGNIVRTGFNHPDELVDGVTYVKAAEVIRMLRLLLGNEAFKQAKNLYFNRYKGSNANTDQFLACFEEVSGRDLSQFKKEWLYTIGYPRVTASVKYSKRAKKLKISLKQTRQGKGGRFHIPLEMSAVDQNGSDIPATRKVVEITGRKLDLEFDNVPQPAFISFNRDYSFYGTFRDLSATHDQLLEQIRKDQNRFNRVEAMRSLTDVERVKLIQNIDAEISENWLEVIGELIRDTSLPAGLKAYLLRIDEQPLDRNFLHFVRESYSARSKLLKTVATRYSDDLVKVFHSIDTYSPEKRPGDGIDKRLLKATLLRTLIEADTPLTQKLAEDHFRKAWNITDKVSALACINLSSHPNRRRILDETYETWKDRLNTYTSYLGIIASGNKDDVFDMIKAEESRSTFKIDHPSHNRALFFPMAGNNKMLWTEKGLKWLTETATKLAPINENSTIRLLACLQIVNKFSGDLRTMVIQTLETIRDSIASKKMPSVAGRIDAYLSGARK
jgi:aminopeptidase N